MRHTAILYVRGVPLECTFDHTPGCRATLNEPADPETVDFVTIEIHGEDVEPLLSLDRLKELEKAAIERVKRDMREAA